MGGWEQVRMELLKELRSKLSVRGADKKRMQELIEAVEKKDRPWRKYGSNTGTKTWRTSR